MQIQMHLNSYHSQNDAKLTVAEGKWKECDQSAPKTAIWGQIKTENYNWS